MGWASTDAELEGLGIPRCHLKCGQEAADATIQVTHAHIAPRQQSASQIHALLGLNLQELVLSRKCCSKHLRGNLFSMQEHSRADF